MPSSTQFEILGFEIGPLGPRALQESGFLGGPARASISLTISSNDHTDP
jgi:hypothetical protein